MADRKVLTQISSTAWEHAADRAALNSLRAIPGFDEVVRKIAGFFGAVLPEHERTDDQQEDGEPALERGGRDEADQPGADEDARDRHRGEAGEEAPRDVDLAAVAEEAGGRVHRDHHQRRPDRLLDRHPAEDDECRHDEEAAADTDDAGEATDGERHHEERRDRQPGLRGRGRSRLAGIVCP